MRTLSLILLLYWGFALLNTILNLLLIRRPRKAALAREPFVSVIIPARNEERAIEQTVRAFLAQDYSAFEVIVVDDRSTDSTGAILERMAAGDARLIVVNNEEPPAGWLGKPWALHQGSLRARGELLLFADSDIHYSPPALRAAAGHIEAMQKSMTALFGRFEMRGLWENAAMPHVTMAAFFLPLWLGEWLSLWPLAVGGGTGNLIRRRAYDEVGGHETMRAAVIDDVGFAQHVRRSGHRTDVIRMDDLVSVRMYEGFGEIVRGFTKNIFALVGHNFIAATLALLIFLFFHAVPFVWALTGDRTGIALVATIIVTRLVLFIPLRYPIWSALFLHPFQVFIWTWIMVRSVWVVGVRRELSWRGRTYDPAQTRFGAER